MEGIYKYITLKPFNTSLLISVQTHERIVKNILQMIYNYGDSDSGGELTVIAG